MKKILALILTLCMVLALAACGSTAAPAATQAPATEAPATEAPATEAPAETEAPVEATEAPVEETEAPVEETEAPVEETEAPVEETEAPVEETEAPVEETEAPVEETEAPVEATEAPAEEPADEAALEPMSYADYAAAELDTEVCIEAWLQGKQAYNDQYGNTTLYLQDEDGAYFVYRLACSQEEYDALTVGEKLRVTGFKSEWSGEVEITDASIEHVEAEAFIAEAKDATELLGKDELVELQNQRVVFKGMTVEEYEEGKAYAKKDAADDPDLYFKVSKDGETYEFCVEHALCNSETEVYQAVEALEVGQVVDLEGFLYWYEGANLHTTGLTVAE